MPGSELFKRSLTLGFLLWVWSFPAVGDTRGQIEGPVRQSINTLKQTQQQEEQWRQEKEKLVARFEQLQQQQSEMRSRVAQLRQQIEATRKRLAAKEKQLAYIEQIASQINPFLEELVTAIKERIADDLPFLTAERRKRVERLEGLMADPDVAVSEKYREVMGAYAAQVACAVSGDYSRLPDYRERLAPSRTDSANDAFVTLACRAFAMGYADKWRLLNREQKRSMD